MLTAKENWSRFALQITGMIVGSLIAGAGGGYIVLQIDNAVKTEQIKVLMVGQKEIRENLREHETNGGIHFYFRNRE